MDDDVDPVGEIRAIRHRKDRQFKTMEAYFEYIRTIPSAEALLAKIRGKVAKAGSTRPPRRPARPSRKATARA